jgi:hypothetical protein
MSLRKRRLLICRRVLMGRAIVIVLEGEITPSGDARERGTVNTSLENI